jgi:Na+-driven multidrug efflux pump
MPQSCATFTEGSVARHVLALVSTSALSLLAVFLVDILTLAYVARLGDQRLLAAVGMAKTLMFLNGAFVSGVIIAAGALLSERLGKHARKRLARLVTHLLIMAALASALIAGAEFLCLTVLGHWSGAIADIDQASRSFIVMSLASCVPMALAQMCAQLLKSQGRPRLALAVLLSGAFTLAGADPLFIFALDMGIRGAGLSCLLAALVSAVFGVVCVHRHLGLSATLRLGLFGLHVRRTARVAIAAMLANLAMPVAITYLMMTLAALGTSVLAGMAVIDRILQLGYCVYFALPTALVPIIAQNLGAGLDERARRAVGFTGKLVVLYGVALWLTLALAGPTIADYFQVSDTGREMVLAFTRYGAGVWILFGLDFVAQSTFLTMGGAWWVALFGWLRGTAGTLPFVYVGAQWFGGVGALSGMWLGNAVVALLAIITAVVLTRRFFSLRVTTLHAITTYVGRADSNTLRSQD